MKKARFFRIGMGLVVCVAILLLSGGIEAMAKGKPPRVQDPEPGYAVLHDEFPGTVIISDGGQYIDKGLPGGEDMVEIRTYDTGALYDSTVFMGEVENASTRKVSFRFDLADATEVTVPDENRAVYDILLYNMDGSRRGTPVGGKYYLSDIVHLRMNLRATSARVVFVVDPGWEGDAREGGPEDGAVTQQTVDNFNSDPNVPYGINTLGHIIYYLDYNGFTKVDTAPGKWTFTPNAGTVSLTTTKYKNMNKEGKKVGRTIVPLAKYDDLLFQTTVSLDSLESAQAAPGKHSTLCTLWGEIKAR